MAYDPQALYDEVKAGRLSLDKLSSEGLKVYKQVEAKQKTKLTKPFAPEEKPKATPPALQEAFTMAQPEFKQRMLADQYVYTGQPPAQAKTKPQPQELVDAQIAQSFAQQKKSKEDQYRSQVAKELENDLAYAKNNPILGNAAIFEKKTANEAQLALSGEFAPPSNARYKQDRQKVINAHGQGQITQQQRDSMLQKIDEEYQSDIQNKTGKYVDWARESSDLTPQEKLRIRKETYGSNLGAQLVGGAASFAGTGVTGAAEGVNLLAKGLPAVGGKVGLGASKVAGKIASAPKAVQAAAEQVLPNAIYGGATPLMRGEDPLKNPLPFIQEASLGAAMGAGLGIAGTAVAQGIGKLASKLTGNAKAKLAEVIDPNYKKEQDMLGKAPEQVTLENKTLAKMKQKPKVEDLFEENLVKDTTPQPHSRTKVVMMNIDDFLKLVPPLEKIEKKTAGDIVKSGGKLNSLPLLRYELRDGNIAKVVDHEGRHRALALKEAGYTEMPVEIHSPNIRWSEQLDTSSRDYVPEFPIKLVQQGSDRTQSIAFPIKRENAISPMKTSEVLDGTKQQVNVAQKLDEDLAKTGVKPATQNLNVSATAKPDIPQNVEPINLLEVLRTIEKGLGITVRHKRVGHPDALGVFKIGPEVVRMNEQGDIDTIAHEVGHNLDKRYNLASKADVQELLKFMQAYSPNHLKYYPQNVHIFEMIAEYFRLHLADPARAEQLAPKFYETVMSSLSKKDLKGLQKSVDAVQRWYGQSDLDRLGGRTVSGERIKKASTFGLGTKASEAIVDTKMPLAMAEARIRNPEASINPLNVEKYLAEGAESPYKMARLHAGVPEYVQQVIKNGLEPIVKGAEKAGIALENLRKYAIAKHAADLKVRGIETGIPDAEIQAGLALGTPQMVRLQRALVKYNNRLAVYAAKNGLISAKEVRKWFAKSPNYIPFQRYFPESDIGDSAFSFVGSGKANSFVDIMSPSSFKAMVGSNRLLIDPVESMVKNTNAIIDAVSRNKVGQALAKLAEKDANGRYIDGSGYFIEKLDPEQLIGENIDPSAIENIIKVYQNGKPSYYQLDPELYASIKSMTPATASLVENILGRGARFIRNAIVTTPSFIIKQLMVEDWNVMLASSKYFYIPFIDTFRGFGILLKNKALVDEWIKNGGAYGTFFSQDRRALQAVLEDLQTNLPLRKKLSKFVRVGLDNFKFILNSPDEARRLRIYEAMKKQGKTSEEAAYISRDILDFQREGKLTRGLSQVSSFLRPNIQGKEKLAREFVKNPVAFTAKASISLAIPTIALYLLNRKYASEEQKKQIESAPSWYRDMYFMVALPGTDKVAVYPKPYDVSWAFSNGVEEILRRVDKNDPRALDDYTIDSFSGAFPQIATAARPILNLQSGIDSRTGAPIVPQSLEKRLPKDQYDAYSTRLAKWLGEELNWSPKKIDYFIRSAGGDYGMLAADLGGDKETSKSTTRKWFVDPFVFPEGKYQSDNVKKFYENFQTVNQAKQSYKFTKEKPEEFHDYGIMSSSYGMIRQKQKLVQEIEKDLNLTSSEKRDKIAKLRADMDAIAKRANKAYGGE